MKFYIESISPYWNYALRGGASSLYRAVLSTLNRSQRTQTWLPSQVFACYQDYQFENAVKGSTTQIIGAYNWLLWSTHVVRLAPMQMCSNLYPELARPTGYTLNLFNIRFHMSTKGANTVSTFPLPQDSLVSSVRLNWKCEVSTQWSGGDSSYFCAWVISATKGQQR